MGSTSSMPILHPLRSAWVISDGAAGNERQALALASALGVPARVLALPLRAPWACVMTFRHTCDKRRDQL